MDIKAYIESGVIEDYCLGTLDAEGMQDVAQHAALYAEVQSEIDAYQTALEKYSAILAGGKSQHAKKNLLNIIDNIALEEDIDIENLPLINKYSDAGNWLRFIKPLLPETLQVPYLVHHLPGANDVERFIVWTHEHVPDETHTNVHETFLLLEGRCRCYIGDDEVLELGTGDFLSIPLHKPHNVEILSGPVMAVIQRVKVA